MAHSGEGFQFRRALFPAGYFAANAIYQGYISLYYTDLGIFGARLGAISAATAASALLFMPLWGALADRSGRRRLLLALLCLAAALTFPLKLMGEGFAWQLFTAALFYAFFSALLPLGDALLVSGGSFGAYRLAGGVSFAAAGALYGALGGKLWIISLLLGLTALFALLLPNPPASGKQRSSIRSLMKNRPLLLLLACTLPLQMSMAYYYTYFAPRFRMIGGSDALLGLGYLICTAAEVPYLLLSGRIHRKWGAARPMCAASALLAIRWLLLGLTENPVIALVSQLLHGGGFIVISVSMAQWIGHHVPGDLRASGQSLLNMVSFGLARILGNLLGGWIAQHLGISAGFYAGAALCAGAGLGLWALTRAGCKNVELLSHRAQ